MGYRTRKIDAPNATAPFNPHTFCCANIRTESQTAKPMKPPTTAASSCSLYSPPPHVPGACRNVAVCTSILKKITLSTGPSRPLSPSVTEVLVTLSWMLFADVPGGRDTRTSTSLSVSVLRFPFILGALVVYGVTLTAVSRVQQTPSRSPAS